MRKLARQSKSSRTYFRKRTIQKKTKRTRRQVMPANSNRRMIVKQKPKSFPSTNRMTLFQKPAKNPIETKGCPSLWTLSKQSHSQLPRRAARVSSPNSMKPTKSSFNKCLIQLKLPSRQP